MKKFKSAEDKAKYLALCASWDNLKQAHSTALEKGAKAKAVQAPPALKSNSLAAHYKLTTAVGRPTGNEHPSLVTSGGSTAKHATKVYSGTKLIGLGQLHKSNMVPVFRAEDAIDIARMRRG